MYLFNMANLVQSEGKACFATIPSMDIYKEVLPVLRQEVSEHPELAQEDDTAVIGNVIAKLHPCPLKP